MKISGLLIFFLSSSSSSRITQKVYGVCEYFDAYQTTDLLMEIFFFWFGVVCEL